MKSFAFLLLLLAASVARASGTTTLIIQNNPNSPVAPDYTVSGSSGNRAGVRDGQDGTYPLFGTAVFHWSRTNIENRTQDGYRVEVSVNNPIYPNVAYFNTSPKTPANPDGVVVLWLRTSDEDEFPDGLGAGGV